MSDSDEDELAFYGTPLPPLEDQQNAPKKADLDLTVRDEKGRRRFHGAFTGGFSAGHFNTVGSVEGWVPSQYISNKEGKWDQSLMRNKPEDYMDDEDFGTFGIAPKMVQTKDKFKSSEVLGFAGFRDPNASVVDVLKDIIKPKAESIGIKLFKSMRRGTQFKKAEVVEKSNKVKSYGCQLPPGFQRDESDDDDDPYTINFVTPYAPKSDYHGIGYTALKVESSGNMKSEQVSAVLSGGKRLNIKGEAFGCGALEGDEEVFDDTQVYGNDDLSNYDFSIGPSTSKSKSSKFQSRIDDNIHFVPATKNKTTSTHNYTLPSIPRGWKPKPPFCTTRKRKSRWDQSDKHPKQEESKTSEKAAHRTMNANTRAILLGEEVIKVVGSKSKEEPKKDIEKGGSDEPKSKKEKIDAKVSEPKLIKPSPMSGFFSDRFVRSSNAEVSNSELVPGLMQSCDVPKEELEEKEEIESETQLGTSKRTSYQWHPHTLLAKRFNVPHPYPQFSEVVGTVKVMHSTNTRTSKWK